MAAGSSRHAQLEGGCLAALLRAWAGRCHPGRPGSGQLAQVRHLQSSQHCPDATQLLEAGCDRPASACPGAYGCRRDVGRAGGAAAGVRSRTRMGAIPHAEEPGNGPRGRGGRASRGASVADPREGGAGDGGPGGGRSDAIGVGGRRSLPRWSRELLPGCIRTGGRTRRRRSAACLDRRCLPGAHRFRRRHTAPRPAHRGRAAFWPSTRPTSVTASGAAPAGSGPRKAPQWQAPTAADGSGLCSAWAWRGTFVVVM